MWGEKTSEEGEKKRVFRGDRRVKLRLEFCLKSERKFVRELCFLLQE